jgi:hypothetical protein
LMVELKNWSVRKTKMMEGLRRRISRKWGRPSLRVGASSASAGTDNEWVSS